MQERSKVKPCAHCEGTGLVPDDSAIGEEMRALRLKQRFTLQHVAKQLRLSVGYISDLEHGRKAWTVTKIESYRRAIGLPA